MIFQATGRFASCACLYRPNYALQLPLSYYVEAVKKTSPSSLNSNDMKNRPHGMTDNARWQLSEWVKHPKNAFAVSRRHFVTASLGYGEHVE